jgi:hypothetical protein
MLNTVLLLTPPDHGIAASATCGHLTFCAPKFPVLHHVEIFVDKMSDVYLEQSFFQKSKNPVLEHFKQRHRVVGAKIFSTKIFSVKNCPKSEIFKLIGSFYQVLFFAREA